MYLRIKLQKFQAIPSVNQGKGSQMKKYLKEIMNQDQRDNQ